MARSVTLLTLLGDLADACDDDAYSDSPATFITKARATRYLSQSANAFALQHLGFGILSKTFAFSTVSGTRQYALPSDFAALRHMTYLYQGEPTPIFRRDLETVELSPNLNSDGWNLTRALYSIEGEFIVTNDPKGVFQVTMRYVPELPILDNAGVAKPDFTADTDVILCKGMIDQWLVFDSAIKVLRKRQQDPSVMIGARQDVEAALKSSVTDRDASHAEQVTNSWDRQGPSQLWR
jgi:hypothetical protein